MKYSKLFLFLLSLIIFSNLSKAEEEVIAGESTNMNPDISAVKMAFYQDSQSDFELADYFNKKTSDRNEFTVEKVKFQDINANEILMNYNDFLISGEGLGDTTTNDLNFDDETPVKSDPNLGLLPERIGFMESVLWSKSGLFRLTGITGDLTPEQRSKEIKWRRTWLTAHQTSGLVTLGLMLASCYAGQMYLDRKSKSSDLHESLVSATIIGYSITGLLAFTAPPPSIRRPEFSTITVHKSLAWLHIAGMVLTPVLGGMLEDSGADFNKRARFHQTSAYITTGIYATAMAVIFLFE
jgi:hypothetical protein